MEPLQPKARGLNHLQPKRSRCLIARKTTKANSCTKSASNSQNLEHEYPKHNNKKTKLKNSTSSSEGTRHRRDPQEDAPRPKRRLEKTPSTVAVEGEEEKSRSSLLRAIY
jgi:hypothetical protein